MLNSNLSWTIATALCVLLGLGGILPAMMSPMMFDSPGSTSNPITIGLAISVALFPLVCLAAALLPWIVRHWRLAKWVFLLPLVDIGIIIALLAALQYFYDGVFGGGSQPR
jgi:small-conductance mechanosensitive channel